MAENRRARDERNLQDDATSKGLNRRTVLKGAAATAGLAAGSGAISGFPTIWAQNIKDVTCCRSAARTRQSSTSRARRARTSASRSRCRPRITPRC